jgi:hypothetical protein
MLATLGLRSLRLPVGMNRPGRICSTLSPAARRHSTGVRHVLVDGRGSAAVLALAGGGVEAFEGAFADVVAFGLGEGGEERAARASW